jgi:hypothetical protein
MKFTKSDSYTYRSHGWVITSEGSECQEYGCATTTPCSSDSGWPTCWGANDWQFNFYRQQVSPDGGQMRDLWVFGTPGGRAYSLDNSRLFDESTSYSLPPTEMPTTGWTEFYGGPLNLVFTA